MEHACGKVHEVWKGPQPVLTHDEEQALEDWLVKMDKTAATALRREGKTHLKTIYLAGDGYYGAQ